MLAAEGSPLLRDVLSEEVLPEGVEAGEGLVGGARGGVGGGACVLAAGQAAVLRKDGEATVALGRVALGPPGNGKNIFVYTSIAKNLLYIRQQQNSSSKTTAIARALSVESTKAATSKKETTLIWAKIDDAL